MTTVDLQSAFDTKDPALLATKLESFKGSLNKAPDTSRRNFAPKLPGFQTPEPAALDTLAGALASPDVVKALSPDMLASLQSQVDVARGAQADLVKDFTLTSPLSTGYVAYDLEAPAKMLTPRPTPLRNRLPRKPGQGTAHRYKRITGFTGTGTGGVGNLRPGITDATTTSFGSINYLRGPKISYAGDEAAVPYLQFSLSDQVPWSAQFAGQGFQDIRQLSQTSVLYSSMLMEERLLLGGRGTAAGFSGALTAPTAVTATVRNAITGEVGNTANIASVIVGVTAITVFGETLIGASAANTGMSAASGKVVDVNFTGVSGAQGYKVYIGINATPANQFAAPLTILASPTAVGSSVPNSTVAHIPAATLTANAVTINFTGGGTGGLVNSGSNPPTVANDSAAVDYDGLLTICSGPNSGYVKTLNTTFSSNPGDEFNVGFAAMYDVNKADPDEILFNGIDRKQVSDLIKLNSNSSAYRISLAEDVHSATIGAVVTGLQNEVTGKVVDFTVHPWLPQGNCPILSWTLPIPDTEVSDVWSVFNVQDYMAVQWPVTQFAYEMSSYWFGTFICFAPSWNGIVQGVVRR